MWFLNNTELQSLHHKLSDVFETIIHSNRSGVLPSQSAPNPQLTQLPFLLLSPSYRKYFRIHRSVWVFHDNTAALKIGTIPRRDEHGHRMHVANHTIQTAFGRRLRYRKIYRVIEKDGRDLKPL